MAIERIFSNQKTREDEMSKAKIWHVRLWQNTLYVSREPSNGPGQSWKVRSITAKAAARKLIRGGTIADAIAKTTFEWDMGHGHLREGKHSPADDRDDPLVRNRVERLKIEVVKY